MKKYLVYAAIFLVAISLIQCKKDAQVEESAPNSTSVAQDSATKETPKEVVPQEAFTYTAMLFPEKKKDSVMAAFKEKYTKEERYTILALNRLDLENAWRADTLMIPNKIESDFLQYSPFPRQLDIAKDVRKLVVFSYPIQAYAAYENGNLVKWGPSSMGKKAAKTKTGLMFTNWKKELAISTVNKSWKLPYNFNIHNTLGIGWHQYDLPGYPASHSCLRMLMDDAKWMFNFGEQWVLNKGGATVKANGIPVIVFGEYGWGKQKPWKVLDKNPNATTLTIEQMNAEIQPFKERILQEQKNRVEVLAAKAAEQKTESQSTAAIN